MKGLVFTEFLELVEERFGVEVADRIITAAELPNDGAYTSIGTYDHAELVRLVGALSNASGVDVPALVATFGEYLFDRLAVSHPTVLSEVRDAFTLFERLHTVIHAEVRKIYPAAELPDFEFSDKPGVLVPEDKYPFWLLLGVVYEHFHTAKSNRSPTTRRLVPEMYVEMHPEDAAELGIKDGDKVRVVTRRGQLEARAQVGTNSLVRPARNNVPRGYMFSPWNLSVADSADPKDNRWLVNGVSHRAFDPVSGQVDFKKLAARIEKLHA